MRTRLAAGALIVIILTSLPACKHKPSSDSQEKTAEVPAAPSPNPVPPPVAVQPQAETPPPAPAPPQPIIVAAGTTITIKLANDLGSKLSQSGQTFSATVDKDVIVDGQPAIPAGAAVSGVVIAARPYGKFAGEANLTLKLKSVNVNNVDQTIVTASRSFGSKIKAKGKVHKFIGGLVKRAEGDEREVTLPAQSSYTFTLKQALEIQ